MGKGGGGGGFPNTRGGRSNVKIHQDRQDKHIEGTKNYKQQIANGKNPSILTENPDRLLREGVGRGKIVSTNKEIVDFGRCIGKYWDRNMRKYYGTTRVTIHYDRNGNAHMVPARPNWMLE